MATATIDERYEKLKSRISQNDVKQVKEREKYHGYIDYIRRVRPKGGYMITERNIKIMDDVLSERGSKKVNEEYLKKNGHRIMEAADALYLKLIETVKEQKHVLNHFLDMTKLYGLCVKHGIGPKLH